MALRQLAKHALMAGTLTLAGIASLAGSANAFVINGNFSNGLNGWTLSQNGLADTAAGSAILTTGDNPTGDPTTTPYSPLAQELGILDWSAWDVGSVFDGSAIYQDLSLNAGDTIRFDWSFSTDDNTQDATDLGTNDFAFVSLTNANSRALIKLADVLNAVTGANDSFIFTVNTGGVYRLGLGVVNVGDGTVNSYASFDNVTVTSANTTPIPTPSIIPALVGVGVAALRKREQAV